MIKDLHVPMKLVSIVLTVDGIVTDSIPDLLNASWSIDVTLDGMI